MATIQFEEPDLHRAKSNEDSRGVASGVYSTRTHSIDRRTPSRGRRSSLDRRSHLSSQLEEGHDEDSGLRQEGDFKHRQVFKGRYLLWLAYQSIGVIYGDIGTSPLYVYSSTFSAPPSYDDLIGVLSIIMWTLFLMVTVKYVLVILHADNEGEGGTFSTYSLLSRYAHITKRDPREASLVKMERYLSGDISTPTRAVRSRIEKSSIARAVLKTMGVFAVSMVMSDGVLTPAQSVLGAVQGLNVVKPDISNGTVVGTTCGILICLFLIQPFGTTKIATTFAPIVIIWLAFNASFGIYNLVKFDHSVLKAFNPAYAFKFLIRNKTEGWRQLGGVLLAFTGVEALFADLGAFSRQAIQLSWLCYTFPCLLLAYIGQAAYISVNPDAYDNPFFNAAPPGMLIPSLVIAVLAAIVASQAIITATFQLMAQIMKLSYFPQIKVVHTSKIFHGQLYVPMLNWLLMIGTVLAAAIYNNTTSLGNAYGVCVMFVTFFDTCMVSLAALIVWRIHPLIVFFPWLTIACLDGTYISSALTKVPDGAWFTITLATVLALLFILWRFGKEEQWQAESEDRFPTTHLVKVTKSGKMRLTPKYGGETLSIIKGLGIFFDKGGETTPAVFSQFLAKLIATPEVIIFFHLRPLETPTVAADKRYNVSRLAIPNCYRLIVRHGYTDEVITPDLAALVTEQVRNFIITSGAAKKLLAPSDDKGTDESTPGDTTTEEAPFHPLPRTSDEKRTDPAVTKPTITITADDAEANAHTDAFISYDLHKLQEAYDRQVLYIIGKEQMKIKGTTSWPRRVVLAVFLWIRDNTRTKIANLRVPTDRVIEVGFVKEV